MGSAPDYTSPHAQRSAGTPARFITFEGGEGAGKSSHIHRLADALRELGYEVLTVREPGTSKVGEAIRAVLLDPSNESMAPRTEVLLYEAARAQVVEEIIRPALEAGVTVLADRFYDSTTAYQAFGRGIDRGEVAELNRLAVGGLVPDRTLVLDVPVEIGLERATRHAKADRLEGAGHEFHERVRHGFLTLAADEPDRVRVVSGVPPRDQVFASIVTEVADLFDGLSAHLSSHPNTGSHHSGQEG